jgi:hypothetical protein
MKNLKVEVVGIVAFCVIMVALAVGGINSDNRNAEVEKELNMHYAHCVENATITNTDPENCKKIFEN